MEALEAARLFVREVKINGGQGPTSFDQAGQPQDVRDAIQGIIEADRYVNDMWAEWDWLWAREVGTVNSGESLLPSPADATKPMNEVDLDGVFFTSASGEHFQATYAPWADFKSQIPNTRQVSTPVAFTVRPDRRIEMMQAVNRNMDFRYDYWFKAPLLSDGSQEILIPFPRIVIARAKIAYASAEDAPEIMGEAVAEYEDLMERLEGRYLSSVGGGGGRFHEKRQVQEIR